MRHLLPVLLVIGGLGWLTDPLFTDQIVIAPKNSGPYKVYRSAFEKHPEEVAIVGSSRASGNYLSSEINGNCYNYGIEKTQADFIVMMLRLLTNEKSEQPVIINFDYEFYYDWTSDRNYFRPSLASGTVRDYYHTKYPFKVLDRVPLVRYYGSFMQYSEQYVFEKMYAKGMRRDKVYLDHGSYVIVESPGEKEFDVLVEQRRKSCTEWMFTDTLHRDLVSIFHQNPQRNFYLVVSPYHPSWFEVFYGYEMANEYLDDLSEIPNVNVINFDHFITEDKYFSNTTHLCLDGARIFSAAVRDTLKNLGAFSD